MSPACRGRAAVSSAPVDVDGWVFAAVSGNRTVEPGGGIGNISRTGRVGDGGSGRRGKGGKRGC